MHLLGKVPAETEIFVYKEYKFEVVDIDNSRVDKLLVSKNERS
jgi:putative hemolysin